MLYKKRKWDKDEIQKSVRGLLYGILSDIDWTRSLHYKSAEAAKSTASLIGDSITRAELGVQIADETASFLNEIVSEINENGQPVSEIASASKRQSSTIAQMSENIRQVSQVIQQNSAAAEQLAAASEEMSAQADMLEKLVSQFKLK